MFTNDLGIRITQWFSLKDKEGDGEFVGPTLLLPYYVTMPTSDQSTLLYTTKPVMLMSRIEREDLSGVAGIIGNGVLPSESDVDGLLRLCRGRRLVFLGDLDPVDYLIFCWLRCQLTNIDASYLGISDLFLGRLDVTLSRCSVQSLGQSESDSLIEFADVFAELSQISGATCHQLIMDGKKVELEAVLRSDHLVEAIRQSLC